MIDRMARLDFSVLTFLCVRSFTLTIDDLIALNKIESLAVLVLERAISDRGYEPETMSSKDVLNWGRSVRESGTFQKLIVLAFGDFIPERHAILKAGLEFPALSLIGVPDYATRYSSHSVHVIESSYGGWSLVNAESEGRAMSIWTAHTTTKAEKMKRQYELSREFSQKPTELAVGRSVSMSYVHDQGQVELNRVAWYHRELKKDVSQSVKRLEFTDEQAVKNGRGSKRRKFRENKRTDVGSLLDTFT
jgi:hypothetical protein